VQARAGIDRTSTNAATTAAQRMRSMGNSPVFRASDELRRGL
jgi:hypothetical protein